jgi:hypothetical protein
VIQDTLRVIHETFFNLYEKGIKIPLHEIYSAFRHNMFANELVSFYGIFSSKEEMENSQEKKVLSNLAGNLSYDITSETTFIFARLSKSLKNCPNKNLPLVSLWYISYCEQYSARLRLEDFDLRNSENVISKFEEKKRSGATDIKEVQDLLEDTIITNFVAPSDLNTRVRDIII